MVTGSTVLAIDVSHSLSVSRALQSQLTLRIDATDCTSRRPFATLCHIRYLTQSSLNITNVFAPVEELKGRILSRVHPASSITNRNLRSLLRCLLT